LAAELIEQQFQGSQPIASLAFQILTCSLPSLNRAAPRGDGAKRKYIFKTKIFPFATCQHSSASSQYSFRTSRHSFVTSRRFFATSQCSFTTKGEGAPPDAPTYPLPNDPSSASR
jgi:hypothetical protein